MQKQGLVILLRHGESEWNKKNIFTGWVDIPLTEKGVQEAVDAGKRLQDIPIDYIFSSALSRAQMTVMIAMNFHRGGKIPRILHEGGMLQEWGKIYDPATAQTTIPMTCAWELNERMYGKLQGLDKDAARKQFGVEQVKIWRRSYDVAPPGGESLKMTAGRAIPYFEEKVTPLIEEGKNVLIVAHGNSLRAIVMKLEGLSEEEIIDLEISTGEPLCYRMCDKRWKREEISDG